MAANEDKVGAEKWNTAVYYDLIRNFWGTAGSADKQADAYAGLGNLYVSDGRYMSVEGKHDPAFTAFEQSNEALAKRLKIKNPSVKTGFSIRVTNFFPNPFETTSPYVNTYGEVLSNMINFKKNRNSTPKKISQFPLHQPDTVIVINFPINPPPDLINT